MQSRFLKQLIYGVFYLAILFGVGYLFYAPFKSPASCFDNRQNQGETEVDCGGPCQSCDLKRLKPIQVSEVQIFDIGDKKLSALFELKNPNVSYGAASFKYKIVFYDSSGAELAVIDRESFIYPGELKLIGEPAIALDPASVKRAQTELREFSWKPVSEFSAPKAQTRDLKIEVKDATGEARLTGLLVNQNSFGLSRAAIIAVIQDQLGRRTGFSKTLLLDVEPFEERSFAVTVPVADPTGLSRDLVKIFVEASD